MPSQPWRAGRLFQIPIDTMVGIHHYVSGYAYEIGGVSLNRLRWTIAWESPNPTRGGWFTITEVDKTILMGMLRWVDEQHLNISNGLRRLIEENPSSKYVRAFLRQEIGKVPEKNKTPKTTKGWLSWLKKQQPKEPKKYKVWIKGWQYLNGTVSAYERKTIDGWVEIPESVMRAGHDAIMAHIQRMAIPNAIMRSGEPEPNWDTLAWGPGRELEIDDTNISSALEAFPGVLSEVGETYEDRENEEEDGD